MRLANRIFASHLGIILVSALATSLTGALLISRAVRSEAVSRVSGDLKAARTFLDDRVRLLGVSAQMIARGQWAGIETDHPPDLAFIVDRGEERALAEAGVAPGSRVGGVLVLPRSLIAARLPRIAGRPSGEYPGEAGLCLFATSPGPRGWAFAGIVLNGNEAMVRRMQEILFGPDLYGKKPFGTATVFLGDTRVATTVVGPSGVPAIGTRAADSVRTRVLEQGEPWLQRAWVVDDWYISAYQPLRGPAGPPIGILYVGVLEKKYIDIRNRAMVILVAVSLPSLAGLLAAAYFLARRIVRPIAALSHASERLSVGDPHSPVAAEAGDSEIRELAHAFNQMAGEVQKREERLRGQNAALAEANRDYQELLGFVTHELNNSIGSLLLNAIQLADGSLGPLDSEQSEVSALLVRDLERFRDMVRNYLSLSRLEKGTLRFSPRSLSPREDVVEPALRRLSKQIALAGLEVSWDWRDESPIQADRELLEICASNLLVNALKYGAQWLRLSSSTDADGLRIGVSNGGPGIPADKLTLLFHKFSRLVQSSDGAGLGLYLVAQIVERHSGRVWCECDPGSGTSFFIWLPRVTGGSP
ncbi:MAG: cache domain-containing protein [Spirochaetes bacterium]|nr:cache domain-containing protein [Spirochaetota bacterium]